MEVDRNKRVQISAAALFAGFDRSKGSLRRLANASGVSARLINDMLRADDLQALGRGFQSDYVRAVCKALNRDPAEVIRCDHPRRRKTPARPVPAAAGAVNPPSGFAAPSLFPAEPRPGPRIARTFNTEVAADVGLHELGGPLCAQRGILLAPGAELELVGFDPDATWCTDPFHVIGEQLVGRRILFPDEWSHAPAGDAALDAACAALDGHLDFVVRHVLQGFGRHDINRLLERRDLALHDRIARGAAELGRLQYDPPAELIAMPAYVAGLKDLLRRTRRAVRVTVRGDRANPQDWLAREFWRRVEGRRFLEAYRAGESSGPAALGPWHGPNGDGHLTPAALSGAGALPLPDAPVGSCVAAMTIEGAGPVRRPTTAADDYVLARFGRVGDRVVNPARLPARVYLIPNDPRPGDNLGRLILHCRLTPPAG